MSGYNLLSHLQVGFIPLKWRNKKNYLFRTKFQELDEFIENIPEVGNRDVFAFNQNTTLLA